MQALRPGRAVSRRVAHDFLARFHPRTEFGAGEPPGPPKLAARGPCPKTETPNEPTDRPARAQDRKAHGSTILTASMGGRNGKPKTSKPNLARSKNAPSGTRGDPDAGWPRHAEGRKSEGRNHVEPTANGRLYKQAAGCPQRREGRARLGHTMAVLKSGEGPSRWGLARHFAKHSGDLERRGLDRPYGGSRYRLRITQIPPYCTR